jgi:CHAT domain-containing protein
MALDRQNPSAGYAALALQANERARARSLLETLAEAHADVHQSLAPDSSKRHRGLQRELNGRAANLSRVLAGKHTEQEAAQADAALKSALADFETFEAELRSSHPRYAALVAARPLDAPAIQERVLDPETVLLEFALGRNRSYVWAVTPSSLVAYELPARAQIEAAARRCHEALTNSHRVGRRADTRLAVEALSRMLLLPVAREIAGKRMLIVADGALQFIPFGALTEQSGNARGEPLVAGHEIVAVPSASVIDSLRQPQVRPSADRSVAVFADPVLQAADARVSASSASLGAKPGGGRADVLRSAEDLGIGGLARLRFTRQEARAITRLAGQSSSLAALDFDASRETATDPALSRYRIVHFATPAFVDSEHPERSGIVLSLVGPNGEPRDGYLRLHDIYNLKLGADLVVLSACQTAIGKEIRGEGLVGLTRGFLYAGALRVVASLWNVRDEGTSEFMTRFYRAMLRDGLTPAAALRRAQLSMWKDPAWSAPFYWAGFTIQGDWRPAPPGR